MSFFLSIPATSSKTWSNTSLSKAFWTPLVLSQRQRLRLLCVPRSSSSVTAPCWRSIPWPPWRMAACWSATPRLLGPVDSYGDGLLCGRWWRIYYARIQYIIAFSIPMVSLVDFFLSLSHFFFEARWRNLDPTMKTSENFQWISFFSAVQSRPLAGELRWQRLLSTEGDPWEERREPREPHRSGSQEVRPQLHQVGTLQQGEDVYSSCFLIHVRRRSQG